MLKFRVVTIRFFVTVCFFLLIFVIKVYPKNDIYFSNLKFSPPRYYVGDSVQLSFKFDLDAQKELMIPEYEKSEVLEVENIDYERVNHTVSVRVLLKIFVPGTRSIPLDFGSGKILVPVYVSSVLDNSFVKKELSMPHGPIMLKGTRLMLVFFVSLLILLPICIYLFIKLCRKFLLYRNFFYSPRWKFFKEIKVLSSTGFVLSDKVFYTKLLDIFRYFLSKNFSCDEFQTATTHTISDLFLEYYSDEETKQIMDLMHRGDVIKFGGAMMKENERVQCVQQVTFLVKKLFEEKNKEKSCKIDVS